MGNLVAAQRNQVAAFLLFPARRLSRVPTRDLREWIALLERQGELVRVGVEVDPRLEVTEIVDRTVGAGGPALLFEHPKGSELPLLINQFGTERRMCLAFGVESLDDVADRLSEILELQPPEGLAAKVRGLKTLKSIADARPRTVKRGACHDVVVTGDDVARHKPDPEAYRLAAERLSLLAEACLVFEDSEVGAASAISAGMDVVRVRFAEKGGESTSHEG